MSATRHRSGRTARFGIAFAAAVLLALVAAGTASGHAELSGSSPAADSKVATSPARVTLTFTEPVELVGSDPVGVVDSGGEPVAASRGRVSPTDASVVDVPLRPGLPEGTYTVRYSVIGADSHVIPGLFVFGIGAAALEEPFLGPVESGPSETGAWGVSSRFFEIAALGGLVGLLAFRWLVWAPALRRSAGDTEGERGAVLAWGRDVFWLAFGVLAVTAMIAEGYLLVVQSASALRVDVLTALGDATGISGVLGDTRFGSLVQLRGALLFAVFALGAVQFIREYGNARQPRPPTAAGSLTMSLVIAALLLAVLWGIAAQGHPSVGSFSAVQIGTQLVHIAAVSVWIAGLALVAVAFLRLPSVAPAEGRALAANVLARFSRVALVVVAVAVLTGVIRSLDELSGPAELWETAYGRSIVYKLLLLCPIAFLALYNRRIVVALRRVELPSRATLRLVRRSATLELALSIAIVVVASLLVAQVPGGS